MEVEKEQAIPQKSHDFSAWLSYEHRKREFEFQLSEAFEKLLANFSSVRLSGLKSLHSLACRVSDNEMYILKNLQNEVATNGTFFLLLLLLLF